ncbi:MAG: hypothetical protein WCS67_06745 [Bacteroidales bacterium]
MNTNITSMQTSLTAYYYIKPYTFEVGGGTIQMAKSRLKISRMAALLKKTLRPVTALSFR